MSVTSATAPTEAPFWFSLPPGFTPLGTHVPTEIADVLTDGLSATAADALHRAVRESAAVLAGINRSPLQFHAAGMHPRPDGGTDLSRTARASAVPPAPPSS